MKRNIVIGILLFVAFISLENTKLQVLEALILLSILIFTPMLMLLVDKRKRDGSKLRLAKCIDVLYPIAAFCAALTFITDVYVFAVVWLLFTGLVAVYGSSRLIERGWKPLAESAIDSSFIYLFLGGFWFFAAAAHIPIMNFSYQLILLTAIHFHYSALIIPAITGFLGRKALRYRKLYSFVALSIMLSPLLIALGIAYSTVIEFIAVLAYLLAFFVYGFLVLTVPFTRKIAKMLVSFSAIVLLCTLTFSLIYAYGRVSSTLTLSINQMIWIHGVVNALGVVLPALVGWLIESTAPVTISYGLPMSRIVGDAVVGSAFYRVRT
ncbi:hypothetical protein JCM16418_3974 [Paenibacillus pini JCM 16418]|uniref:YndJ-like protein n=1 Tax=Paenibacillus pini JCM 16418 TaxID=1236976 RepID=W7YQW2_9BACL|nr:hypothetical protein JCM16418_3974 [Paenibacillus pini JCM 16418]